MSRRSILLAGGSALVIAGVRPGSAAAAAVPADDATTTVHLVRPQDMLVLDFDFFNLKPAPDATPPQLQRVDASKPAYIVARFEAQHVTEETVYEGKSTPVAGQFHSKAVGPSRIVFNVPGTVKLLPYSEEGLLEWWQWVMQVVTGPAAPDDMHTDLLLVDWLHLSPSQAATWSHATAPVEHDGRTELWHTRLALRDKHGKPAESIPVLHPDDSVVPTVRAFAADTPTADDATLYRALLRDGETKFLGNIVSLSSDTSLPTHKAVRADVVSLSALGATLDLDGRWDPTAGMDLAHWEHHSWLGRDNKVVIEEYGFLFPFGHRALLITETKRILDDKTGLAYLEQREFIRLAERTKSYPIEGFQQWDGRAFPVTQITIKNTTLPDLPEKREPLITGDSGGDAFWIQDIATNADVVFVCTATSVAGKPVEFAVPLAFMTSDHATNISDSLFKAALAQFGDYADLTGDKPNTRRVIDLHGQDVAYAEEVTAGTTSHPTARWFWGVEGPVANVTPRQDTALFFPRLLAADAQLPAVDAMIGSGGSAYLVLDDAYVKSGFGHIPALAAAGDDPEVYVRVQDSVDSIAARKSDGTTDKPLIRNSDDSSKAGGVAAPSMAVGALSRTLGHVSGSQKSIDQVQKDGKIVFTEYFADLGGTLKEAVLFGGILLSDIVDDGTVSSGAFQLTKKFDTDKNLNPIGQTITGTWKPAMLRADKVNVNLPYRPVEDKTTFTLKLVSHVDFYDPKSGNGKDFKRQPKVTVSGTLTDFRLILINALHAYIEVTFSKFTFSYEVGGKPTFDPKISDVAFRGPFEFVNVLQTFMRDAFKSKKSGSGTATSGALVPAADSDKVSLGPTIDIGLDHVGVGAELGIPDVGLGLFTLTGIKFSAGVKLPFFGDPVSAYFKFSSKADKFKVTVYGLGGGGSFDLEVDSRGLKSIEASIEIVGNLELDLIVASGRVTLEIGVKFKYTVDDKTVKLTGYICLSGRLSVLGLISITAELYVDLEYQIVDGNSAVVGHAHLIVAIDIFFFHKSVDIEFQKTILGSPVNEPDAKAIGASSDRTYNFGDLVSRDDWKTYCAAFAA